MKAGRVGYSVGKTALNVGAHAGAATAIQEAGLHSTQQLRTAQDTFLAIGGSVILGGILGTAGARFLSEADRQEMPSGSPAGVAVSPTGPPPADNGSLNEKGHDMPHASAEGYWKAVRQRAWREARKAAWGDGFATAKAFGSPAVAAVAAVITGAAYQSVLAGVTSAAIVLILWPIVFFLLKLGTVPAVMHTELQSALDAERAASAAKPVDMNNVFGLLDRVQRHCSLLRKGTYDRQSNLTFAKEIVADITGRYTAPTRRTYCFCETHKERSSTLSRLR